MATLEITTVIGCKLMCTVCPQDKLIRNYSDYNKILSLDNYKKILSKIPKTVRIDFSGMSEPWLNPECNSMLEHTINLNYKIAIYTTLVGMSKNDCDIFCDIIENNKDLIEVLCLHLPDKNNNMRGYKCTEEYLYSLRNVLRFNNQKFFKTMTMDINNEVHQSIKHLDIKFINSNHKWYAHTRADSLSINNTNFNFTNKSPINTTPVKCASTPFYDHNVLLPNGDVFLCCMDYNLKHKLGNLLNQSYSSLFESEELKKIKDINKLEEYSKCSICKSCTNVIRL